MTAIGFTVRLVVLWALAGLAACSSPNPNLYTIAPVPGPIENGAPRAVLVREVVVSRYLERTPIVRSSENYRLSVMANDWWGEPLSAMLSRVLVRDLSLRLPRSAVYGSSSPISLSPDATLDLSVTQLDEDASGNLVLEGQASISFSGQRPPLARSFRFSVVPPAAGTDGEVAAISDAVGRLATELARMLGANPVGR